MKWFDKIGTACVWLCAIYFLSHAIYGIATDQAFKLVPNYQEPVVTTDILDEVRDSLVTRGGVATEWFDPVLADSIAVLNEHLDWWREWGYRECWWGLQDSIAVLNERLESLAVMQVQWEQATAIWSNRVDSLNERLDWLWELIRRTNPVMAVNGDTVEYLSDLWLHGYPRPLSDKATSQQDIDSLTTRMRAIYCPGTVSIAAVDSFIYRDSMCSWIAYWYWKEARKL